MKFKQKNPVRDLRLPLMSTIVNRYSAFHLILEKVLLQNRRCEFRILHLLKKLLVFIQLFYPSHFMPPGIIPAIEAVISGLHLQTKFKNENNNKIKDHWINLYFILFTEYPYKWEQKNIYLTKSFREKNALIIIATTHEKFYNPLG